MSLSGDNGHRSVCGPLCFVDPREAIRTIADSLGRGAREQLLEAVVSAWVDSLTDSEMAQRYDTALESLEEESLVLLAEWHAKVNGGLPVANLGFFRGVFDALGARRREVLLLASTLSAREAFATGVDIAVSLRILLPTLEDSVLDGLLSRCTALYIEQYRGASQ